MKQPAESDHRGTAWFDSDRLSAGDLLSLFDSALDAIIVIDPASRIVHWNRSAEQTFGWSRAEAAGRDLASLVIPERLREAHNSGMRRYLATGEGPVLNSRIEVSAVHRSGEEFPVELTIIPLGAAEGLRFCAFIRDISELKRNAQRLARRTLEAEVLYEVVSLVSQGGTLEESLRLCQQKICEISGWAAGHSYRPDNDETPRLLLPTGIWHFVDDGLRPLEAISRRFRFRPGEGLPGTIWQTGQPAWIIDVATDPTFIRRDIFTRHGIRSAFGFPVRAENRLSAVLEFFSTSEREPEPELILTVRSLALQLGRVLERQSALAQQQVLLRELSHRIGNTLAIIGAIFRRLAATSGTKDDLRRRFEDRLTALAAGHRMLSESDWRSTSLATVVAETLRPYCEPDGQTCRVEGPPVELSARLTMVLNMVLHELATNAAKYGALAGAGGRLAVRWTVEAADTPILRLSWTETCRPASPVAEESAGGGFGSELIRLMMAQNKGSESRIELTPEGLQAEFVLPLPDLPLPVAGRPGALGPPGPPTRPPGTGTDGA